MLLSQVFWCGESSQQTLECHSVDNVGTALCSDSRCSGVHLAGTCWLHVCTVTLLEFCLASPGTQTQRLPGPQGLLEISKCSPHLTSWMTKLDRTSSCQDRSYRRWNNVSPKFMFHFSKVCASLIWYDSFKKQELFLSFRSLSVQ